MGLDELMGMPWSWQGPREVTEDGQTHWELTVRELPDFFVAGRSREEVLVEALPALTAFLGSYLENNETPPLPTALNSWRVMIVDEADVVLATTTPRFRAVTAA